MKSLPKIDWICLSGDDYWNSNPHSRYHIAKQFSKNSKVLWINSIGTRFPSIKKKNGIKLIIRKFKSYLIYFRKPEKNFYVVSPITIPVFKGKFAARINTEILWLQIKLFIKILRLKNIHFFVSSPSFGILADKIKRFFCIYYYSDLYVAYRELKHKNEMILLDKKVYDISKLIYCASDKICSTLGSNGKTPKYLPHSVDLDHFNKISPIPKELMKIPHPIIGYYGTLSDSNDWEIIDFISEQRPSYNFVFIGKKFISLPELEERKNIHFIDKISYQDIPAYGSCFDVAIMFWILREWILHSSPLKLLEYFALGKPVVSVDIPEVKNKYGNVVLISNDKYSFLENIDKALMSDRLILRRRYDEILKNHSWEKVVNRIYDDVEMC